MKIKNYIEIEVAVGFDNKYSEKTEMGEFKGREILRTVRRPLGEAQRLIQESVRGLDYAEAVSFAEKYEN